MKKILICLMIIGFMLFFSNCTNLEKKIYKVYSFTQAIITQEGIVLQNQTGYKFEIIKQYNKRKKEYQLYVIFIYLENAKIKRVIFSIEEIENMCRSNNGKIKILGYTFAIWIKIYLENEFIPKKSSKQSTNKSKTETI